MADLEHIGNIARRFLASPLGRNLTHNDSDIVPHFYSATEPHDIVIFNCMLTPSDREFLRVQKIRV